MSAATGLKTLILFEYLKDLQESGAWFCSTVLKWITSLKPSILGPIQEPERSPLSERRWAVVVVARFGVLKPNNTSSKVALVLRVQAVTTRHHFR